MPGWNEQSPFGRQRGPNGLAIGPWTGQIRPEDDGAGFGLGLGLLAAGGGEPDDVAVVVGGGAAARRGSGGSGGRLSRADATGERSALVRQQLRLVHELLLGRLRRRERGLLRFARGGQLLLRGDELLGHRLLLFGARAHGGRLLGDVLPVRARALAQRVELVARGVELLRDPAVLRPDLREVLDAIDQLAHRRRREKHVDGVGIRRLVRVDDSPVEAAERDAVLTLQRPQPRRLFRDDAVQALEVAPRRFELRLQDGELRLRMRDVAGDCFDLHVRDADLLRQRACAVVRAGDLRVQRRQPLVDRALAVVDVTSGGGSCEEEHAAESEQEAPRHRADFHARGTVSSPAAHPRRTARASAPQRSTSSAAGAARARRYACPAHRLIPPESPRARAAARSGAVTLLTCG